LKDLKTLKVCRLTLAALTVPSFCITAVTLVNRAPTAVHRVLDQGLVDTPISFGPKAGHMHEKELAAPADGALRGAALVIAFPKPVQIPITLLSVVALISILTNRHAIPCVRAPLDSVPGNTIPVDRRPKVMTTPDVLVSIVMVSTSPAAVKISMAHEMNVVGAGPNVLVVDNSMA
jgi:hypothetical protein